jgi:hypothetical protein
MSPDEPASLDDRYFGPIPSARSSAKPSRYRPSRSCSAAIPVQAANENSSARLLHPPLFPANSPALQAARFPSDILAPSIEPPSRARRAKRPSSRPERHRHDVAHVHQLSQE